jgi:hypothetical protein
MKTSCLCARDPPAVKNTWFSARSVVRSIAAISKVPADGDLAIGWHI